MKILNFFILILLSLKIANGQDASLNCLPENTPSSPEESSLCPLGDLTQEEMDALPNVTIFINIHFINGPQGNFYPGGSTPDLLNGNHYAALMVDHANYSFDNMVASPLNINSKIGDAKINYSLYTDPNNPNDLYGGVWYWNSVPSSFPYSNVINVVMLPGSVNENLNGYTSGITGCINRVTTIGAYYHVWKNPQSPQFGHWAFSPLMSHEIFHTLGLCHSFAVNNGCTDPNPADECLCSSGHVGCGDGSSGCCTWNTGSTNLMSYVPDPKSLSICQWSKAYNNLITRGCPFVNYCNESSDPIVIGAGTNVVWDDLRLITRPVRIMPTATLTITCEARFSTNSYIEVRRGAKLIVDGATLTNLCPGFWQGIQVWGNPNLTQPNPLGNNNIDEAGIVRVINGATIKHARTAISTASWALGGSAAWANSGGAVYCENSNFIDNKRAIEFMKYTFPNKSQIINCEIKEDGNYAGNSVGVTIWECIGIIFTRTRFQNLDIAGIYGIDFGARIYDHNQFRNIPTGIESYNTLFYVPNGSLDIGQSGINPNYFKDNRRHIYCSSTSGLDRVNIINNDLFDAITNGIILEGESYYKIQGNRFKNTPVAVASRATGDDYNLVICNHFDLHTNGIKFIGFNEQSQFLDNCIKNNVSIGTVVETGTTIRYEQGAPGRVANNCFQSSLDIFSPMTATNFGYYVKSSPSFTFCDPNDVNCERPTNNLSDGGNNNYYWIQFPSTQNAGCLLSGDERFTPSVSLNQARINEYNNRVAWESNPLNQDLRREFEESKEYTRFILRYNLKNLLQNQDYETAASILLPNNSSFEMRMLYNIRLLEHDYSSADSLLNVMPSQTQEQQWFKQIQLINIQRLQESYSFVLTEQQELFLRQVTESDYAVRTYAKALLALFTGESFAFDVTPTELLEPYTNGKKGIVQTPLAIYPNPVVNQLEIEYSKSYENGCTFEIFNILGNLMFSDKINGTGHQKVDLGYLVNGHYRLNVIDSKGNIIETKEFIVLK